MNPVQIIHLGSRFLDDSRSISTWETNRSCPRRPPGGSRRNRRETGMEVLLPSADHRPVTTSACRKAYGKFVFRFSITDEFHVGAGYLRDRKVFNLESGGNYNMEIRNYVGWHLWDLRVSLVLWMHWISWIRFIIITFLIKVIYKLENTTNKWIFTKI